MSLKNKKILFLCPYPRGKAPSQRLKFEQYFEDFKKEGYELYFNSFISLKFWSFIYKEKKYLKKLIYTFISYFKRYLVLFTIHKYDIIYIHLWGTPLGLPVFEWILIKLNKEIIYDIDDLVFLHNKSHANSLIANLKGKNKAIYLMKKAKHVITCTPFLDQYVKQFNKNTTDISSTVDTKKRYLPINNYQNDHQIIIGWSGSHSTSKYLYLLTDVLKELASKHEFKLVVMGDGSFDIEGVNIEAFEWKEEIEISTLQRFDIGLYPLPNEQWVWGKSGLKAIQYMALGVPTVASNIGTIDRIIQHQDNGYLVDENRHEEWTTYLSNLIQDESLRKKMGLLARQKIDSEYSIHQNKKKYIDILNFF